MTEEAEVLVRKFDALVKQVARLNDNLERLTALAEKVVGVDRGDPLGKLEKGAKTVVDGFLSGLFDSKRRGGKGG